MDIYGVVIIIIGWFVAYFLGKRQNVMNKRRDIRIQYLINAWQLIEKAGNRENNEFNISLEIAVADIQLFGSKKQIELMQKFVIDFAQNKRTDTTELLIELRKDLRNELHLEKVPDIYKCLRIKQTEQSDKVKKK